MLTKMKLSLTPLILLVLLLPGGEICADSQEIIDGRIYYGLGQTCVVFPGLSSYPSSEVAHIPFVMKFINGDPPSGEVTSVVANFSYEADKWTVLSIDKTDWPGEMDYVLDETEGHITLIFTGEGLTPSTYPYTCATINYQAKCQTTNHLDYSYLVFDEDPLDNYVIVTDTTAGHFTSDWYTAFQTLAGHLIPNWVYHMYWMDEDVEANIGDLVTLTVEANDNFRKFSLNHFIDYDHSKLEFVECQFNEDIFVNTDQYCYVTQTGDSPIEIYLVNECVDWPNCFLTEFFYGTEVYYLTFRVLAAAENEIPISFMSGSCFDSTWTIWRESGEGCAILDSTLNPPATTNGSIIVNPLSVTLRTDCGLDYITKTGAGIQEITFATLMSNTAAVGDYSNLNDNGGIDYVLDVPSCLSYGNLDEKTDSLDFHSDAYNNDGTILYVYQQYKSGMPGNFWPGRTALDSLVALNLYFNENTYVPSYEDREVALEILNEYVDGNHDWSTFVEDTTGTDRATITNGMLTTDCVPTEIKMGEYFCRFNASSSDLVDQNIYIRANYDIGQFSVTVSVDNDFCVNNVHLESGVSGEEISSNSYRLYNTAAFFHEATQDDSVLIATMTYGLPEGCEPLMLYFASVYFSNAYMYDSAAQDDQFVALSPAGVRGRCMTGSACELFCNDPTDASDDIGQSVLPSEFELYANRPNPFNPRTVIAYDVPVASHVRIEVINILGRGVKVLVDEQMTPGRYETVWDGTDESGARAASGIYLYKMKAGDFTRSRKMMLMK
ncbi:MAG: T9SS type A sorting domain-containing protein [Candidatus Zixiibacteriota bacterium]|nr:MAG: T9SS type A sorting domain-containing protein [candidate division Zixibacteria bacterium]